MRAGGEAGVSSRTAARSCNPTRPKCTVETTAQPKPVREAAGNHGQKEGSHNLHGEEFQRVVCECGEWPHLGSLKVVDLVGNLIFKRYIFYDKTLQVRKPFARRYILNFI